jgi:hypothetical protein
MVGPFIFADHMGPEEIAPGHVISVDAHPHIGLATVTYLFEGRMVHRDSTGAVATIEPGAVNWMTAGAGVCHTERSHPDDETLPRHHHGLQTWVALPDDAQDGPPSFSHTPAADIPSETVAGATVRIAVGTSWNLTSPVETSSPLVLADLFLDDAAIALDSTQPERAVLVVEGSMGLGGQELPTGHLAVLAAGAAPILAGTGRAVMLGGEPVGPRHIWWNFVHRDQERIEAAKADWAAQRFPTVPGDHEPWVPLPPS